MSLIPQPGSVLPRAAEVLLSRAQASPPGGPRPLHQGAPGLSIEALSPGPSARSLQRPQRSSPEVTAGPSKGKLRPGEGHTPPAGVWAGVQRGTERAAATPERAGAVRRGGGDERQFPGHLESRAPTWQVLLLLDTQLREAQAPAWASGPTGVEVPPVCPQPSLTSTQAGTLPAGSGGNSSRTP